MKLKKDRQKIRIYISWIVVVLYVAMIFYFSSQDGTKSHRVSADLLQYLKLFVVMLPEGVQKYLSKCLSDGYGNLEFILRKAAHFTEYFILSFIFYRAVVVSGIRMKKSMIVTLIFCFLYAVSDEVHQVFVPGGYSGLSGRHFRRHSDNKPDDADRYSGNIRTPCRLFSFYIYSL